MTSTYRSYGPYEIMVSRFGFHNAYIGCVSLEGRAVWYTPRIGGKGAKAQAAQMCRDWAAAQPVTDEGRRPGKNATDT
jgi:hypothetical protein